MCVCVRVRARVRVYLIANKRRGPARLAAAMRAGGAPLAALGAQDPTCNAADETGAPQPLRPPPPPLRPPTFQAPAARFAPYRGSGKRFHPFIISV